MDVHRGYSQPTIDVAQKSVIGRPLLYICGLEQY